MAAPSATARGTPAGIKMPDGYSAKITCASNTTISFWEKTVQPPGLDGMDPIDTTTMHNVAWRTRTGRHLITLTECTIKCSYDPNVYNQIIALINKPETFTVTFQDGSTLAFFGILHKFVPDALEEGKMPEATVTITPTNYDATNNVEAAPVLTSVSGT